ADAPGVLVVTAHPDDETLMAATIYTITHTLGGTVDLALVTDGSVGFHYAMIAEPFYGIALHDEEDARQNLSPIRKQELREAGRILGLREIFFLDAFDHEYTTDVDTVLQHVWDADAVRDSLGAIMQRGGYDFVLALLPTPETHGHHKAATILALEAASRLPADERPVVLGADFADAGAPPAPAAPPHRLPTPETHGHHKAAPILALEAASRLPADERPVVLGADFADAGDLPAPDAPPYGFTELEGYPVTRVDPGAPILRFDRTRPMEE